MQSIFFIGFSNYCHWQSVRFEFILYFVIINNLLGGRGPVVRALGLHAVVPGSNRVLTSSQDLFPIHTLYGAK